MAYSLSFSQAFFTGDGEVDLDEMEAVERPTNVFQAIISMDRETAVKMTMDVFEMDESRAAEYVDTDYWATDVLDKVIETNTCGDMSTPVDVWIDSEGWWRLDIY